MNSTASAASLNAFREANGRAPLARSAKLQRAAEAHARDMAQMDRMIHRGSDGSAISDRVKRQGYRFGKVAENIAKTGRGQARAMQIWIDFCSSQPLPSYAFLLQPFVYRHFWPFFSIENYYLLA